MSSDKDKPEPLIVQVGTEQRSIPNLIEPDTLVSVPVYEPVYPSAYPPQDIPEPESHEDWLKRMQDEAQMDALLAGINNISSGAPVDLGVSPQGTDSFYFFDEGIAPPSRPLADDGKGKVIPFVRPAAKGKPAKDPQ